MDNAEFYCLELIYLNLNEGIWEISKNILNIMAALGREFGGGLVVFLGVFVWFWGDSAINLCGFFHVFVHDFGNISPAKRSNKP